MNDSLWDKVKKFLGEKALVAIERLGGMIVCLIGVQMLASGIVSFIRDNFDITYEKASQFLG